MMTLCLSHGPQPAFQPMAKVQAAYVYVIPLLIIDCVTKVRRMLLCPKGMKGKSFGAMPC